MQIDWTTFILEILNFGVLVWILQRFFYKPVLAVLDKRRALVQSQTENATRLQESAEVLKKQYEARMKDWEQERQHLRQALDDEFAKERERRLGELKKVMADEAKSIRARALATQTAHETSLVRQAAGKAFGAAAQMLQRLASPALTVTIVQVFQEDLAALNEIDKKALRDAAAKLHEGDAVDIASAHALDDATRRGLIAALSQAAGQQIKAVFREMPELIAGLRISVGECALAADLAGELEFFQQRGGHA